MPNNNYNITDLLNQFIALGSDKNKKEDVWREKPVSLLEFFTSKEMLNEQPHSGKQTEFLEAVDYVLSKEDPLTPAEYKEITEMAVLFGKGSGKDFLVSGIVAYMCYRLCCLSNPQDYYGFAQDEQIDIINVALNAYQASNVFFKKLKARLKNCKWFRPVNYNPSLNTNSAYNEYQITKNQIRFYKNITAHSTHSEATSFEGFNPILVVFDEIGGFEMQKAEEAYNTFLSSASTRFNDNILLIFISFPRSAEDFMMLKYNESLTDPKVWAIKGKSWEVNPKINRSSLQKHYDKDPEGARTKYECDPPAQSEGLYQFPEKVDACVRTGKSNPIVIESIVTQRTITNGKSLHFSGLKIYGLDSLDTNSKYFIGGDAGVTTDSYTICLMKALPTLTEVMEDGVIVDKFVNKPVEELLLQWKPSKKDRLPVDLLNVADILEEICKRVHVESALFDKFNSAECVQRLQLYGVDAEDKSFSNPFQVSIHTHLKGLIYTGFIELLDYPEANEDLKHLKIQNGNKITHSEPYGKDLPDARAAAAYCCYNSDVEEVEHFSIPAMFGARRKI